MHRVIEANQTTKVKKQDEQQQPADQWKYAHQSFSEIQYSELQLTCSGQHHNEKTSLALGSLQGISPGLEKKLPLNLQQSDQEEEFEQGEQKCKRNIACPIQDILK